jgi:hypothetical protein
MRREQRNIELPVSDIRELFELSRECIQWCKNKG